MATATEAPATTAEGLTQHTPNQLEALAKLRDPFQPNQVSKLPKIWCNKCNKAQYKVCDDHTRKRCPECDSNMTTGHLHLDYVGHAELTGRLLQADPMWTWEPLAFDTDGLPKFDPNGGLWIRLTVAGHSRLGYGDSQGKTGPNAVKEAIGDALRNAGMRFGAALTLWSKTDMDEANAQKEEMSAEPSREDRLEDLYGLMQKRWGHLEGLRAVKVLVGEEQFHESQVADATGQMHLFGELIDARIRELVAAQKLDAFLRKVRGSWDSITATEQHLVEATDKGLLDQVVPYGPDKTPTRVEDLLTERIAELKPPKDGDGAQDAPQPDPQAATSPVPAAGPAADDDPSAHVQRLMAQVADCWNNPMALSQIKGEAEKRQVLDHEVQGPPPGREWTSFRQLLDSRFAELRQAADDRNAA